MLSAPSFFAKSAKNPIESKVAYPGEPIAYAAMGMRLMGREVLRSSRPITGLRNGLSISLIGPEYSEYRCRKGA